MVDDAVVPIWKSRVPQTQNYPGAGVLLKGDIGSRKQIKLCDDVVSMGRDAACLIQLDDKMFADS